MNESDEKAVNGERKAQRSWPNTMQAAAATGLSRKKLDALVGTGALWCSRDSSGVMRWDPDLLAIVAEARDDDDDESGAKTTLTAEMVAALKQSNGHAEALLRMVVEPAQKLLDRALAENDALRKRVASLEARRDELAAEREKLASEAHLRELLNIEQAATNRRKDEAIKLVKDFAPKLLQAASQGKVVVDLLRGLSDEQRALMLETDFLTEDQKQQVRALLATPAEASAGPASAPEVVTTSEEPAS